MTNLTKEKTLAVILISYLICAIIKYIEFFFIQTDQTFIADNVICKIFCIIFIVVVLRIYKLSFAEIGFNFSNIKKNLLYALFGFALGIGTFAISYSNELDFSYRLQSFPTDRKRFSSKRQLMKQITVSGAIILRTNPETNKKEIFATQRGYGDYKDGWEIPGGKLEPGETPEACIEREIKEELATEVKAEKILGVVDYDYPNFHLTMHCILCTIVSGELKLLEHEAAQWLTKENLRSVDWLPADLLILDKIEEIL